MARPLKPLVRGGGYYPSRKWTPLVYNGGYTTMNGGEPPIPVYWKTATGVSPLTLANALAHSIKSLTQYGKCTQASTPTPSSPVDIKCNNGVVEAKHQSGLPVEYTLLEFIESTGTQYIETGVYLDYGKDIRITGTVVNKAANKRKVVVGNYNTTNTMSLSLEFAGAGQSGLTSDGFRVYFGSKTATLYSNSTAALPLNTDIDFDFVYIARTRSFTLTCIANGQTYTLSDVIPNMFDAVSGETMTLFLDKRAGQSSIQNSLTIKAMSITNDVTAKEYVPVNKGNNAGMYDTVGGAFYANAGTNAFVGGSSVADPLITYIVGTPEVLTVSASGAETQTASVADLFAVGDYKDEQNIISGAVTRRIGIKVIDGTENWVRYSTTSYDGVMYLDDFADNLIGAPCLSLMSTHLKATEAVTLETGEMRFVKATGETRVSGHRLYICVNTTMKTVEAVKAFLAAQYAAGTPVIVLYPLAQETTERGTANELESYDGTTIVSAITNVDPVTLSVEYASSEE